MSEYVFEVEKERSMKDEFMSRHPESPFLVGDAPGFQGLAYFPVDERYRVPAKLERLPVPKEATLRTNRDGQLTCRYIGDMTFEIDGESHRLRVFHAGEQVGPSVFVPFRDKTCGEGSYEEGRYLILQLSEDDHYTLDFNLAFNPYCAYTDRYECGFPPPENDLPISISAGEMMWIPGPPPEVVEGPSRDDEEDDEEPAKPSQRTKAPPRSSFPKETKQPSKTSSTPGEKAQAAKRTIAKPAKSSAATGAPARRGKKSK
jgi:uncharacterized protein